MATWKLSLYMDQFTGGTPLRFNEYADFDPDMTILHIGVNDTLFYYDMDDWTFPAEKFRFLGSFFPVCWHAIFSISVASITKIWGFRLSSLYKWL